MTTDERPTAVVVNDDGVQLRLIAALLANDGLHVVSCSTAEEALGVLPTLAAVHVIVTDLYMPGIDGWRFCRLLRSPAYAAYNGIPILVCSATFAGIDATHMTAELGANAFLPLPYEPAALLACVHALLSGHLPKASSRVLLIDNDVAFATRVRCTFEAHGYAVTVAGTADVGQRLWQELTPDIVILASQLPDRPGETVLSACRRPDVLTVVLMLTTNLAPELALQAMQLGANAYVHKPCEPDYLLTLCAQACRERALLRVEDLLEERTQRLRDSEMQFGALFENIPDAVFIAQPDGQLLVVNAMAAQWLESTAQELIGTSLHAALQVTPGTLQSGLSGDRGWPTSERFEAVCMARSGRRFPVEVHTTPIHFHGRPAFLSVARNITERQQAFAELQAAKDYAENLIRSSLDIIVSVDKNRRIIAFNKAAQEAFGYDLNEVLGQPVHMLYADDQQSAMVHQHTVRDGRFAGEISNRRKDGLLFHTYLSASVLRDAQGDIIGTMGISRDITVRKQAEEALQVAKEAAESASRTKSALLANVSHEIRTPMNGIMGMIELALSTALSAEQRDYLETVQALAESLLGIINDLLDCAKIEAAKLMFEQREFRPRQCVDETIKALAVPAYSKGLTLCYAVDPEVPETCIGDTGRLRQILMNLIGNAIKFTPQGDIVVRVTLDPPASWPAMNRNPVTPEGVPATVSLPWGDMCCLHCTVQDSGIGIPPGHLKSIFEPFTQADSSTTRLYGGTGLGLAIASQLVALMHGEIWVESTVEVGSTFHFTAYCGRSPHSAPWSRGNDQLAEMPVLVVERHPIQRQMLEQLLTHWHMRAQFADTLPQVCAVVAQAQHEAQPLRLLLLDTNIPEWEEMVQAVRGAPTLAGGPTPALVLTLPMTAGAMHRWPYLGSFAWVMKPLAETELWQAILEALEQVNLDATASCTADECVERALYSLRLLLAEGNAVHQRFAARLLEKRGHTVVVANDGLEVLQAFDSATFDLILMDLDMPRLDGFGATAAIRVKERSRGTRIPIVAMAVSTTGELRERCLAIGMDACMTQSLGAEELFEVVESLVSPLPPMVPESPQAHSATAVLDQQKLWSQVDHDIELLHELVELFLDDVPRCLEDIRMGLQHNRQTDVAQAAHRFKGALGSMSAVRAFEAASQVETSGRLGDLPGAARAFATLENEIARLIPVLTALRTDEASIMML